MMAGSARSNQRPDTLMQDRRRQFDEIFLQRTAGPYIRVKGGPWRVLERCPLYPRRTDIGEREHQVRKVPNSDMALFIQWPRRRGRAKAPRRVMPRSIQNYRL